MKRLVVGVLAHVDSGKTTLSEALLYRAGSIRKLGRVDHRDAFLDTDALEKARGITIFAKQAVLTLPAGTVTGTPLEETQITLLDTPGHVDFSAEAERTLQVLDYAVLVISGTDGIQSHTMTLWRLLERYHVPTFIYVNKMDLPGADKALRLRELRGRFGDGCVDFTPTVPAEERAEALGVCSEPLMEAVLATGTVPQADLITAITRRQVFPCYFGAALRLDGIDDLLNGLQRDTRMPPDGGSFGARIFKIGADESGARMTYLKVTDGVLKVKSNLVSRPDARVEFEEKADQLRVYSGSKYRLVSEAPAGTVCAVLGPTKTYPGQGLGVQPDARQPMLEPVLNYRVELPEGADPHYALLALRTLEDEDPQLHVVWNAALGEIHLQLMGEIQLEILQSVLQRLDASLIDMQQQMAQQVLELACDIARQVVRQELSVNPNALLPVVREAVGMLVTEGRPATVRLNPVDMEAMAEPLREEVNAPGVQWMADAAVPAGGCLVESAGTVVDGSIDKRWQRAIASLGLQSPWDDEARGDGDDH